MSPTGQWSPYHYYLDQGSDSFVQNVALATDLQRLGSPVGQSCSVAVVVGMTDYEDPGAKARPGSAVDAIAVATTLTRIGFVGVVLTNPTFSEFWNQLTVLESCAGSDVIFFFAGHVRWNGGLRLVFRDEPGRPYEIAACLKPQVWHQSSSLHELVALLAFIWCAFAQ